MRKPVPPKLKIAQPKAPPKPKPLPAPVAGQGGYDENGKRVAGGAYNRDGFMEVVPGKAPKVVVPKKDQGRTDTAAAKKAGFLK